MAIRGIRQGIPGGYLLGRKAGARGPVGLIPLGNGANGTATAGGFVPQVTQTTGFTNFNNAGVWNATSAYNPGDVVTYNGGAYVNYVAVSAPGPNPSPDMDDAHWFSQGAVNTVDSNFVISTGQLQLASIASGDVLGNSGGSSAEPTAATLTAMIDRAFGSTEGQILQRGASAWQVLAPGTAGHLLTSGGASALNSWTGRGTGIAAAQPSYTTTSLTGVMVGVALSVTPNRTGAVLINLTTSVSNSGGGADGVNIRLAQGTGTAPVQGAAATGAIALSQVFAIGAGASFQTALATHYLSTGLTLGTAYWFDIVLAALNGGTADLLTYQLSVVEV